MCIAVEKEEVVAGFINNREDGLVFSVDDVYEYIRSLWNAGCGPVVLNFKRIELIYFLDDCDGVCLRKAAGIDRWQIDKSLLNHEMTPDEYDFCYGDKELAKKFDLFCKLQIDPCLCGNMLDALGFRFIHESLV